jgi:hypothetical protein
LLSHNLRIDHRVRRIHKHQGGVRRRVHPRAFERQLALGSELILAFHLLLGQLAAGWIAEPAGVRAARWYLGKR